MTYMPDMSHTSPTHPKLPHPTSQTKTGHSATSGACHSHLYTLTDLHVAGIWYPHIELIAVSDKVLQELVS